MTQIDTQERYLSDWADDARLYAMNFRLNTHTGQSSRVNVPADMTREKIMAAFKGKPMTLQDMVSRAGVTLRQARWAVGELEQDGKVKTSKRYGIVIYELL